ncbi:MAG: hypothetical protein ACXWML_07945, partial [Candidatus Binataceae bacterium]
TVLSAAREALPSAAANDSISACIDSGLIQTLCYQAGATRKSMHKNSGSARPYSNYGFELSAMNFRL